MARSRTGISRLESQNAALVRLLRWSMLCLMSSRRRMPQNVGMRPTALYGSIMMFPRLAGGPSGVRILPWSGRNARQPCKRHRQLALVIVLIDEVAFEIADVGLHVEMTVTGHVEHDRFTLALTFAAERLIDR